MATLFHFPTLLSLSSHKPLFSSKPQQWLSWKIHEYPPRRSLKICAFSIKRPRSGRKVKSNEELCNDIREFVAAVGLPDGHVPSVKELSQHGRNDLANIVRRRGYKLIKRLLTSSPEIDIDGFNAEKSVVEKCDATGDSEDILEDNVGGMLNESADKERNEVVVETNIEVGTQSRANSQECSEHACGAAITLNGSTTVAKQVAPPVAVNYLPWSHDNMEAHMLNGDDLREDLNSETTGRDNQIEINHLKFMLHQKELELSRLKEQIEKEKNALSALQTKAETEIHKAQKLVSEKDAELHAAEESLSGLEEVQIEYSGDGEIVEVAGSFNGWHHRIKMDPKPSSTIKNPIESRKPKLWSTVLWLYPGIYEIKFIVDGKWEIDPQRESTDKGGICNNILQVDR
ncbi:uncharacterized protein LOC110420294 isoform X3 [Herrania umbratica]|uniref:Uncharacterized protein LOC110420294 isoform X3 n=1 Tax=Herrania umbratica TaxID=108875 RepID=A0A6J1APT5_9ROSI|nr:uncharacterized protein LOC110420294 isoform X3 [Herrania umbratica]